MNTVLEKGNIIAKIRRGEDLNQIIDYVKSEIYQNGPRSSVVLEIASYFKLFQPEYFKKYEQEIITTMGLFFKHPQIENLAGSVFFISTILHIKTIGLKGWQNISSMEQRIQPRYGCCDMDFRLKKLSG